MDEDLFQDVPEARLRRIFGRFIGSNNESELGETTAATASANSAFSNQTSVHSNLHPVADLEAAASGDAVIDPLFPSLEVELPQLNRPAKTLQRPPWDPRDRWHQLRPTQPYYAPPESDLPAQFRYEDLSAYEKSETMDIHQDRLLRWLYEKFQNSLEYVGKSGAAAGDTDFLNITGEQAIKQQVFTELQILDEKLSNLGLDSSNPVLLERRRQLLEQQRNRQEVQQPTPAELTSSGPTSSRSFSQSAATASSATAAVASRKLSPLDEFRLEFDRSDVDNDDFDDFVSPSLVGGGSHTTQTVVTVHEATWRQQPLEPVSSITAAPRQHSRKQQRHSVVNFAAGDEATAGSGGVGSGEASTIECEVDILPKPAADLGVGARSGHRVQQFGDVGSLRSGESAGIKKPSGRRNSAEESV